MTGIIAFVKDLDFYKGVNGKFMKIVNFNRRTNYIFFELTTKIIKKLVRLLTN